MNRINIDDLKCEYICKVFGSLEVLDVIRNDSNLVVFRCKYVCGNIKDVQYKRVIRGVTKSCGCRASTAKRLDVEKLKQEYIGKQINWLTVEDVFRDNTSGIVLFKCRCGNIKDISKKTLLGKCTPISCGCYKHSEEKSTAQKQYYADHPECILKLSEKRKQWAKENPEKCKAVGKHNSELYDKDPSRRLAVGERISNWFKYDKEGVQAWVDTRKRWRDENPDLVKEASDKRVQYFKDHYELELARRKNISNWAKENPDKVRNISDQNKSIALNKRATRDYSALLEFVHPDYVDSLISGNIKTGSIIKTKCPVCSIYAEHRFNNKIKNGIAMLCRECHVNLTSSLTSKYEQEIADCISAFYNGECIKNDRSILNGKELDLYYPEKRIAIEFNGDYWHDENHKSKEYHYNKFKMCLDKNILLVSIFESEWNNRKDNIVAYIRDLFSNCDNSITFENDGYMNNNYPSFGCAIDQNYFKEDFYTVDNVKVYTCGYSKIICS